MFAPTPRGPPSAQAASTGPPLGYVSVALVRRNRNPGVRRTVEGGSVSQSVQKTFLERAQDPVEGAVLVKPGERAPVVVEQAGVGVVAKQQLQQELVQVEATEQARPRSIRTGSRSPHRSGWEALPARSRRAAAGGTEEAARGTGIGRGARRGPQAHTAVFTGERLHDEARFSPWARVQHVARARAPRAGSTPFNRHGRGFRRTLSSLDQPARALTQISRWTREPNKDSILARASAPAAFRTRPPFPITMPF